MTDPNQWLYDLKEKDGKKFRALVRAKGLSVRTHSWEEILAAFAGEAVPRGIAEGAEPPSPRVTPRRAAKTPQIASEPPRKYASGSRWISFGSLMPKYAPTCVSLLEREFNLRVKTEETEWGDETMIRILCWVDSHDRLSQATLRWATAREAIYKMQGI